MDNLLDLQTRELLRRFGKGSHKPGSGSAAALQGLLAAQLIRTVVSLTNGPKHRDSYQKILLRLLAINEQIESRIYPALEQLLQEDAVLFNKVIELRVARDNEKNISKKRDLQREELRALVPATELPLKLATYCAELADSSIVIFDHGFKSARGDSGVALAAAVSAVTGCISIIELNLLSFEQDDWRRNVEAEAENLKLRLAALNHELNSRQETLKRELESRDRLAIELSEIASALKGKHNLAIRGIESLAIKLQRTLWVHRDLVFKQKVPTIAFDALRPDIALKNLKYQVNKFTTLGQFTVDGTVVEAAGEIDQDLRVVSISDQPSAAYQNFTLAHELGHALLHEQTVLHRDKAMDGSVPSGPRDITEFQADKFASYFLMPAKLVKKTFFEQFSLAKFSINADTAFALNRRSSEALYAECNDKRALSMLLASTELFAGAHIESLAKRFNVSIEAMAIRLEELDLVEY